MTSERISRGYAAGKSASVLASPRSAPHGVRYTPEKTT
jgi:hypothetical protein